MNITAKTLEEAITRACVELGVTSDQLEYNVVDKGSKGFFGLGARSCVISAWDKSSVIGKQTKNVDNEKSKEQTTNKYNWQTKQQVKDPERAEKGIEEGRGKNSFKKSKAKNPGKSFSAKKPYKSLENKYVSQENTAAGKTAFTGKDVSTAKNTPVRKEMSRRNDSRTRKDFAKGARKPERDRKQVVLTEDPGERAEDFLDSLFKGLNKKINIGCNYDEKTAELSVNLSGDDVNGLISQNAQVLDALQYITSQVVNKRQTGYIRIKLDIDDYRKRRREDLEKMALEMCAKVKETRKSMVMEPMNAYERRIIHSVLQPENEVITRSEGEEPYRHVVISPVKK